MPPAVFLVFVCAGLLLELSGPAHAHRCGACGQRWTHRGRFFGQANEGAHRCPRCAALQYLQDRPAGAPAIS